MAEGIGRFRVNGYRQRGAISFAFRFIPKEIPSFEKLGLPDGVGELAEEHRGLVLVTGATGSGKSTTLAAIVNSINRSRKQHIVTIEDPIEFVHDDWGCIVNQREVGIDTESYLEGLRRVLRQDPDVILIGELRDEESAKAALQAPSRATSSSRRCTRSTRPRRSAATSSSSRPASRRWMRQILAGVLRGVISQRLLPKMRGGRVAAVEVMVNTARIADLIREGRDRQDHRGDRGRRLPHMQSFSQHLVQLVLDELVDEETAANAAEQPPRLRDRGAAGASAAAPTKAPPRPRRPPRKRPRSQARGGSPTERPGLRLASRDNEAPLRPACPRRAARVRGRGPARQLHDRLSPERGPRRSRASESSRMPPARSTSPSRSRRRRSNPAVRSYEELLALWHRAGAAYGVPWQVLAAINKIESDFGRNMGPSSAGASAGCSSCRTPGCAGGWTPTATASPTRGIPRTPSSPRRATSLPPGAHDDISRAIFAYNHAQWYVDEVLSLAADFDRGRRRLHRLASGLPARRAAAADRQGAS